MSSVFAKRYSRFNFLSAIIALALFSVCSGSSAELIFKFHDEGEPIKVFADGVTPTNGVIEVQLEVGPGMSGTSIDGFTVIFGTSADSNLITFGTPMAPESSPYSDVSSLTEPPLPMDETQEVGANSSLDMSVLAVTGEILRVPFTIPAGILSANIPLTFSDQPFRNLISPNDMRPTELRNGMIMVVPEPHAALTCMLGVASLAARRRVL